MTLRIEQIADESETILRLVARITSRDVQRLPRSIRAGMSSRSRGSVSSMGTALFRWTHNKKG